MNKVKLLLKQTESLSKPETFEYEVMETSDARWICGEVLDRCYVKELCRKQSVKIVRGS